MAAAPPSVAEDAEQVARGAYVFNAAGCRACHTDDKNDGALLAGGPALQTPFGVFYAPNITPHPEHGIGAWSDDDFVTALREGIAPDGGHYFPVFPYTSFTGMTDADMLALKAYIFSLPPVDQPSREHDIDFPFGWRFLMTFWNLLNVSTGPLAPDPDQSAEWNRGRYLAEALAHCGECHTPRDMFGATVASEAYSGSSDSPLGGAVPNVTPDPETGIGDWSEADLLFLLRTGLLPSGDVVGQEMGIVVKDSTSKLTEEDQKALVAYLRSLPPIRNKVETEKSEEDEAGATDEW